MILEKDASTVDKIRNDISTERQKNVLFLRESQNEFRSKHNSTTTKISHKASSTMETLPQMKNIKKTINFDMDTFMATPTFNLRAPSNVSI